VEWIWPLGAGLAASTAALLGSAGILLLRSRAERAAVWLLSFAVGTLLAAATLGLLPEALHHAPVERVMPMFLAGMVGFMLLERALRWRQPHHHHPGETHPPELERATAAMLLWGDALHNFVDGLVLGISYRVSHEVGIAASVAIFAHEVPQELGDFAILLASGMPKRRAFILNYLSALAVIPGAAMAFAWASASAWMTGWLLPVAAGGFVYIALANLVPALHQRRSAGQLLLLLLGIAVIRTLSGMEP